MKDRAVWMAGIQLILLAVLAGTLASSRALAFCRITTSRTVPTSTLPCPSDGIPLEWERRCIAYAIDVRGSSDLSIDEVRRVAEESFAKWVSIECDGASPGLQIRQLAKNSKCQEAEFNREGRNVNTIAFLEDWRSHGYDPLAYALTTVWHDTGTGEILDADIQINETIGPYAICPAGGCTDSANLDDAAVGTDGGRSATGPVPVDLPNVLTHEAGHFFGLGHTPDDTKATMFAVSPRGETAKRDLKQDDIDGFCAIYPPGSLPMTCDFSPTGGLKLDCEGDDGGCSVHPMRTETTWPWVLVFVALWWRRRSLSGGALEM